MSTKCIRENTYGTISCDDYEVLDIIRARYGRISPFQEGCGKESNWFCVARNSLRVVQRFCQLKNTCSLHPHSSTFNGDPCRGYLKFLEVQYNCQSTESISTRRARTATTPTTTTTTSTTTVTAPTEALLTVRPTDGISTTIAESPDGTTAARIFPSTSTNITSADTLLTTVGETSGTTSTGTGVIAGIAVGGLLALLLIALIVVIVMRRRKPRDKQERTTSEVRQNEVYEMNAGFVGNGTNADGGNATYYSTVTKEPDQLVGDNDYQSADNVYFYVDQDKEIGRGNGKMTENILYAIR